MFDVFVTPLHCPRCGGDSPDAEIQTYLLREGATLRVGVEIDAVYLTTKSILESDYRLLQEPAVGGPIRLLDVWSCSSCSTEPWAMIELVDRRIHAITAIALDRAALGSANFISETNANILADSLRGDLGKGLDSLDVLRRRLA